MERRLLAVVLALAAAGVVASILVEWGPNPSSPGVITVSDICDGSVVASFEYTGTSTGFLSNTYPGQIDPAHCQTETLDPGSTLTLSLFVHNLDQVSSHELTSVAVNPPFRTASISPGTPVEVQPGANVSFALHLQLPWTPGEYDGPTAIVLAD
jgi:hypothetical protein